MQEIFDLFKKVLLAHIETKTEYSLFHEKSAGFYELLFECFHTISEKKQDLGAKHKDCDLLVKETYESLKQAKKLIEGMIKDNKEIGMDNLLRGLVDKLDNAIGNSMAFLEDKEEEKPKPIIQYKK